MVYKMIESSGLRLKNFASVVEGSTLHVVQSNSIARRIIAWDPFPFPNGVQAWFGGLNCGPLDFVSQGFSASQRLRTYQKCQGIAPAGFWHTGHFSCGFTLHDSTN